MKSEKHKHVKNIIHNEFGITREYIKDLVLETVNETVEKKISEIVQANWFTTLILRCIGSVLNNKVSLNTFTRNEHVEYIQKVIREEVIKEVTSRINFSSIDFKPKQELK